MRHFITMAIWGIFLCSSLKAMTPIDTITFGNAESEAGHGVTATNGQIISGGLNEPARILLPNSETDWRGGKLVFTVRVDEQKTTYLTFRFWGSDVTVNRLILACDGKQVGYRHLGDYDLIDISTEEQFHRDRFFYVTTPLPATLTNGRNTLGCELQSTGRIWSYGTTFALYQKPMLQPTRGVYKVYSHTEPQFIPPPDEKQGSFPGLMPVRPSPGAEVLDEFKVTVNKHLNLLLDSPKQLTQEQMTLLASAYHVKWTVGYRNPRSLARIVESIDQFFVQFREKPAIASADWLGLGQIGQTLALLEQDIQPFLDKQLPDGTTTISRRGAYAEMLIASRDWHKKHRRLYTNQSMINDLYVYLANRGVAVVDSAKADSERKIRRYLYESIGLEPWRDSDPGGNGAPEVGWRKTWSVGPNYRQITPKGLTRELGFVGAYGEVLGWVSLIYDATRPNWNAPGDVRIKNQLEKIARARAYFRYPAPDSEGYRSMRMEAVVGWRDTRYPGNVMYGLRSNIEAYPTSVAAITRTPESIGYFRQMIDENQFFANIKQQLALGNPRIYLTYLKVPDEYELLRRLPGTARLPMTDGQPDFVFSDETDGVVAIKNGEDIFYASLYWRARKGINYLARVHYIKPSYALNATVKQEIDFTPSGMFHTRPDQTNFGFADGGLKYPDELPSAHAGEKLPIATIPKGIYFEPNDENVFAGRGELYRLNFGNYFLAMNMSDNKSFTVEVPKNFSGALNLVTKRPTTKTIRLKPQTTAVLYRR